MIIIQIQVKKDAFDFATPSFDQCANSFGLSTEKIIEKMNEQEQNIQVFREHNIAVFTFDDENDEDAEYKVLFRQKKPYLFFAEGVASILKGEPLEYNELQETRQETKNETQKEDLSDFTVIFSEKAKDAMERYAISEEEVLDLINRNRIDKKYNMHHIYKSFQRVVYDVFYMIDEKRIIVAAIEKKEPFFELSFLKYTLKEFHETSLDTQDLFDLVHLLFPYYPDRLDYVETKIVKEDRVYEINLGVVKPKDIEIMTFKDLSRPKTEEEKMTIRKLNNKKIKEKIEESLS